MRKFVIRIAISLAMSLPLLSSGFADTAFAGTEDAPAQNTLPPLQIAHRTGIKVVVQVNQADTMPNGVSKQVMATKNLYDEYLALDMKPGKDFQIVMVFRADGSQFLLTDAAYDQKVKQPHPPGNASREILNDLNKGGVRMYECGVAMRLKGYATSDIAPYGRVVGSGIAAIIDLEKSGYLPITP